MKEKSREVEEREKEREGKALLSRVLLFFFFLLLAAFQSSEGRPCWVERSSSLSFKSHSLSRLPLRISQRDQQRRGSDRKTEKDGEKRDRRQTCGKQDGGRGGGEIRLGTQELKTGGKVNLKKSQRDGRREDGEPNN